MASEAYRRSQILTRYSNGLVIAVNGSPTDSWKLDETTLPPNGWYVRAPAEMGLTAFSTLLDGHRVDYVDSPAYLYADGRGRFTRFAKAACDGAMIAHKRPNGVVELIPVTGCTQFAVSLDGRTATAVALDSEGRELGPAETRLSRGLVEVLAVPKAFSYLLTPGEPPALSLSCPRDRVVPGETVDIAARTPQPFTIPKDTKPGTRLWKEIDGAWIDYFVEPLVEARVTCDAALTVELLPHLPGTQEATVTLGEQAQTVSLTSETPLRLAFPLAKPQQEEVRSLPLKVQAGPFAWEQPWWLRAEYAPQPLPPLSPQVTERQGLRGASERSLDTNSGANVMWAEARCGDSSRNGLNMHPPYKTGTGYVAALLEPVDLPAEASQFRALVGKVNGSDPGDGILFRVAVVDADGRETIAAERIWGTHGWTPLRADLSRWAGQRIRLKLIVDAGPADNPNGDWACWAELRLESLRPLLLQSVHSAPVTLRRQPGPQPAALRSEELHKARSATLHFQAIGLQHDAEYVTLATLNGIALGEVPGCTGDEANGVWSDAALALPAEATATLEEWNEVALENPKHDCFKVRRFWIELELADGRRVSSHVTLPAVSQPANWQYAEGERLPAGAKIVNEVRFPAP